MRPRGKASGSALLRSVVRGERRRLALATALFGSHQLGEVLVPVVAGLTIDRAVVTGDGGSLLRWLAVLAVVFAVLSTSWRWADRLLTRAVECAAHDVRLRVVDRWLDPTGVRDAPPVGQVVSIAGEDALATARILVAVAAGVAGTLALAIAATILVLISGLLGLVIILTLLPTVVVLQLLTRPMERRVGAQRADAARAAALATDLLQGIRVLKGLRRERLAVERYRTTSRASLAASLRATRLVAVHEGLTVATTGLFVALVALLAGRLATDGDVSVGAFVAAVGVTQFFVGPLWRIGFAAAELATARASATRVAVLLDTGADVVDGTEPLPPGGGAVAFRGVHHRGLAGLELEVPAGRLVGIVVDDPVDARTVVDLLARVEDPGRGSVDLDGASIARLRLAELRRAVVVSPHDAALFAGTVAENVAGAPGAAGDDVERTLAAVALGGDEGSLAEGATTVVAARGASLSGGQRQRVALARALAPPASVLVLHDPTTSIDAVTEASVATGLRERRRGRTTIVVTTSPALLAAADEVVFVEQGVVADRGRHDEVSGRNGAYAELVLR